MDDLEKTLLSLKEQLDNYPTIKEFLSLKEVIEKDQELKSMRLEIAKLAYENKKIEHDNLVNIYNSHPLVVNYNEARKEVITLLNQIKEILEQ